MEIEAKFSVPDAGSYQRLQTVDELAGLVLSAGRLKEVRDTYLDTPERLLLSAGYACRRRDQDGDVLITLKGMRTAKGAIHRREEMEIALPSYRPPQEWLPSDVRDLVLTLIGDQPLAPLFVLHQKRFLRQLQQSDRVVAELSLDEVQLEAQSAKQTYLEVEVELRPGGSEEELVAISALLQDRWKLKPQLRSKFERAQVWLAQLPSQAGRLLTPQERAACAQIAARDDLYARRAQALLELDDGMTQIEAGRAASLSPRRVRYWLAGYRSRRLGIFPTRVLDEAKSELRPVTSEMTSRPMPKSQPEEVAQPLSLEVLFQRFSVDRAHARTVADNALVLFDELAAIHGLPRERRSLLETAALVHNIGLETNPGRHHAVGRDILLKHPPATLNELESSVVALTTFMHHGRITPKRLAKLSKSAVRTLPGSALDEARVLAALVRVADGLDYSQSSSTHIDAVSIRGEVVEVRVSGGRAAADAARARVKSDLWRLLFAEGMRFTAVDPAGTVSVLDGKPPDEPGLEPHDTMSGSARKTLELHFRRMLYHEPGTRIGEDTEELHDMRVATRRMRAAFQVFGDHLDMKRLAPLVKDLRRTARALGRVRDLDVFWDKTGRYLGGLAPDQRPDLTLLREAWEAQREIARGQMLDYLDSERYASFRERFAEMLQAGGFDPPLPRARRGGPTPRRLQLVVPLAVHERWAAVRAYDDWVKEPTVPLERLHQLRIAAKRLRYAVEFFKEVLGPEARALIDEVKSLQDHLGDLQDAVVASSLLRDFLIWGTWKRSADVGKEVSWPAEPVVAPGVATYLAARQTELQRLLRAFPEVWRRFQSAEVGQLVSMAVAPLL